LLTQVEKDLDQRIFRIWNDNPMAVVGSSRGVYLPGFGILFSVEMNMVTAPGGGLMGAPLTDADKVALHKKKIERLPQLKAAMKDILVAVASQLDPIPANEQIVIAAILPRSTWEESGGVPIQLTAQAAKQDLVSAQGSGGSTAPSTNSGPNTGRIDSKSLKSGAPAGGSTIAPSAGAAIKFSELN
jgi:hypothetical protein